MFNQQHQGVRVKETAKIERSDGTVVYEIEIRNGIKSMDCLYHEDGSIVK
jgi:uncharacterized membrane protein YkoI